MDQINQESVIQGYDGVELIPQSSEARRHLWCVTSSSGNCSMVWLKLSKKRNFIVAFSWEEPESVLQKFGGAKYLERLLSLYYKYFPEEQ